MIKSRRVNAFGKLYLRASVNHGKDIVFSFSADGKKYIPLNDNPIDGFFLPPWDRAVRAALVSKGPSGSKAVFEEFALKNE